MFRGFASIALLVAISSFGVAGAARARELLRVEGETVKWRASTADGATVITYAVLTGTYSLPVDKHTLSPDNCGVMRPFADIVSASPAVSQEVTRRELLSAFAAWEGVAGVKFVEAPDLQSANIIIGATNGSTGQAFANLRLGGGQVPAVKALGAQTDGRSIEIARPAQNKAVALIEQAYVCLSPRKPWKAGFDGNLAVYDLRYTFMHEIGHSIGLDHPGSSGSIMGYRYDEHVRELQASDITAVQSLYGPPKHE